MKRNKRKKIGCSKSKRCSYVSALKRENARLKAENKELKAQIDDLRRSLYGKKKKKQKIATSKPKKKGAPFGHKGKTRTKPKHIDEEEIVIPEICPHCGSTELEKTNIIEEHIQEEIVIPKKKVTKYRKTVCKCKRCKKLVRGVGRDEMPGSYIGPHAKAIANYLRYDVGISHNKLKKIFEELFGLPFHQTTVGGFENQLRTRGQGIYDEMKDYLKKSVLLYIDESGWKKNGIPHWLWCYCNKNIAYYHIDESRGGKVIKTILGVKFRGIIISDFLSAYNAIEALKQKCLPHVLRANERLYISCGDNKEVDLFCQRFKEIIKRVIYLFKNRRRTKDYILHRAAVISQCKRLLSEDISHKKTGRWCKKLKDHQDELYTCLFHPNSDFNNNFVERQLRLSVIMRKITFGNRSENGIKNHSVNMSLLQTAKLHKVDVPQLFSEILTDHTKVTILDIIRPPP